MDTVSIKQLFQKGYFNGISGLRENENSYPYVTLVKNGKEGKTSSTNLYFSKKSSELVKTNFNVGDSITKALADANVVLVENNKGEKRFKISLPGESKYESGAILEDIFGAQTVQNFDFEAFTNEFQTKEVLAVAGQEEQTA